MAAETDPDIVVLARDAFLNHLAELFADGRPGPFGLSLGGVLPYRGLRIAAPAGAALSVRGELMPPGLPPFRLSFELRGAGPDARPDSGLPGDVVLRVHRAYIARVVEAKAAAVKAPGTLRGVGVELLPPDGAAGARAALRVNGDASLNGVAALLGKARVSILTVLEVQGGCPRLRLQDLQAGKLPVKAAMLEAVVTQPINADLVRLTVETRTEVSYVGVEADHLVIGLRGLPLSS